MDIINLLAIGILPGLLGGTVRGLVGVVKSKDKKSASRLIYSLITSMIVGGVAGAITGLDWRISLLAGYAGTDLLESLYKIKFSRAIWRN